ncbi:hypothetical protein DF112_23225 [Burkholderia stagnalis]|nr:hypothetical protein DF112_23225 [Burkholderia stagnalis]
MMRQPKRSALLAVGVAFAAFLVTVVVGHRAWPLVAASLLAIPLAALLIGSTQRWRQRKLRSQPSATVTDTTLWQVRLNDVPAAEVREHVIRCIERELDQHRKWDLKIASVVSYAGAVMRQISHMALCVPLVILAFAGLLWATNPAGFAHLAHQILTAGEADLRVLVDGVAWTAIGFTGIVLTMWHILAPGPRPRDHYDEAWHEEIRLSARIAPRGELTLHLSDREAPTGYRVTRGPHTVRFSPVGRHSSSDRRDVT